MWALKLPTNSCTILVCSLGAHHSSEPCSLGAYYSSVICSLSMCSYSRQEFQMFPGVAFRTVLDSNCLNTSMSLKSTRDLQLGIKKRSSVWPYKDVTASNEKYSLLTIFFLKKIETSNSILISKHSSHLSLEWVAAHSAYMCLLCNHQLRKM